MMENRERLQSVLRGRLESLHAAGVQQLPKARRRPAVEEGPQIASAGVAVASAKLKRSPVATRNRESTHQSGSYRGTKKRLDARNGDAV